MNIKDFENYVKTYPLYAYIKKEDVGSDFEEIVKNSDDIIFLNEKYNSYLIKYNEAKKCQSECHSDFSWWSYETVIEQNKYLLEFVKRIIAQKFDINSLPENKKLEKKATEFDKITSKIDEKINDLKEFKPASYKAKIELLESIKKGEIKNE